MSLALYRKYRPATFAEVIGQDHVTGPLRQALAAGRVQHAYLFSGPRGCGKTSSARILARSLNCAQGPTPEPCGVCESCIALAPNAPGTIDVIEIDAATHGLVDDARELREKAVFAPAASRFRVYIIDEAHMLSAGASNALLKIIEEPPAFLKFVLATTEPDKLLPTIRSRTHHYPFRLVPPRELLRHLDSIAAKEGIEVDPLALSLVVRAGAGSVRDALSVLDQLLAGAGSDGVTYEEALHLLGYTDATLLDDVVDALSASDGATLFETVDRALDAGHSPRRFAEDLLERVRDLLLLDAVPDAAEKGLVNAPEDLLERMAGQASRMGRASLVRAADVLNAGLTEMRGTATPRLVLELLCGRLLLPSVDADAAGLAARIERIERRLSVAVPVAEAPEAARPTVVDPIDVATAPNDAAAEAVAVAPVSSLAGELDAAGVRRVWDDVLKVVRLRKRTTYELLHQHAQIAALDGRTLTLTFPTRGIARQFTSGVSVDVLREALREALGVDWQIEVTAPDGATPQPAPIEIDETDDITVEDEAPVALLQKRLGGKVIGEIDAS